MKSGDITLMEKIDTDGYDWIKEELGIEDERVIQDREKEQITLGAACGLSEKLGL